MSQEPPKLAEAPEVPETPKAPLAASIEFDGEKFIVIVPVSSGKASVYGIFAMAQEEASKYFFALERQVAKEQERQKTFLSHLRIPGARIH